MSDLGGHGISRATLRIDRWGVPGATVTLVADAGPLQVGDRVTLTIGDLAIPGTLRPGGAFGGTSRYTWVAGAGGWDSEIPTRSYADPGGLPRSRILADLGAAADEAVPVLELADGSVGVSWVRPAGLARDALDALSPHASAAPNLGGQWWVDPPSGVVHVGPRRATACAPASMSVISYDPATQRARVALSDDAIAQLLPGASVTAQWIDGATPSVLVVGSLVVHVEAESIEVELFGERGAAELFADLVAALTAYTRWHAAYPMQVSSVAGAGTNVDPLNELAAALPGLPALPQWPGVPGLTAVLQKGAPLLVAFAGGSPGGAAIVGYGPGVAPSSLRFQASGNAALDAATVSLGGPSGSGSPVVVDALGAFTAWAGAVTSALAALGHPVTALAGCSSSTTKAVP